MRPPARVWRCETPAGPEDLAELRHVIRVYLAQPSARTMHRQQLTPLEKALRSPMPKKKTPEDRPLTEGEKRQDEIQARLAEERRRREAEHGPIDMLDNSVHD